MLLYVTGPRYPIPTLSKLLDADDKDSPELLSWKSAEQAIREEQQRMLRNFDDGRSGEPKQWAADCKRRCAPFYAAQSMLEAEMGPPQPLCSLLELRDAWDNIQDLELQFNQRPSAVDSDAERDVRRWLELVTKLSRLEDRLRLDVPRVEQLRRSAAALDLARKFYLRAGLATGQDFSDRVAVLAQRADLLTIAAAKGV
jgi:hypothetical protein